MRILQVVGGLNRGGTETALMHVLRHIDRKKYQFDFLVHTPEPCHYDDEARSLGARIIPCLSPSNPLRYAYNFHRILRGHGPYDCIHSHVHQFSGFILALAAAEGVTSRIVHSRTDTRMLDGRSTSLRRAYIRVMGMLICRYTTTGLAVSEEAAASLFPANWKSQKKWSVCPSGIDMASFDQPVDPRAVREELGIPLDAHVVGHVGRFVEVKNHRFLVEIAQSLFHRDRKALFLLVGDGPIRGEIEKLVRSRGLSDRFIFPGIRSDIPRILKGAMDCFILPSTYEGLPMVLLEAQAAGLHCIVSTAVSSDGDIGSSAVTRVSLSQSADVWARCLQDAFSRSRTFHIPKVWSHRRSIDQGAKALEHVYASVERGSPTTADPVQMSAPLSP